MSHPDPAVRERVVALLMAAIDGEMTEAERRELDALVAAQPELRAEWTRFKKVKEVTATMRLQPPPDELWDRYAGQVFNRAERGVAWLLVSAGAIVLAAWGLWHAVSALFADASLPVMIKGAITAVGVGALMLLVSVGRERFVMRRRDHYSKDVTR